MTFRLDRFATLYVVSPFQRRAPKPTSSIPILMYHSISADAETGVRPYYRTSTSRQLFASQMKCLHENGYRTVSLAEVASQLQKPGFSDDKRIVITFDDGYNDFYCGAFPLLSRFGFSATVFLPTAFIGNTPLQFKGRDCLTWAEVRELSRHGVLFGSHTVTHPQLCKLDWGTIQTEIENRNLPSKTKLDSQSSHSRTRTHSLKLNAILGTGCASYCVRRVMRPEYARWWDAPVATAIHFSWSVSPSTPAMIRRCLRRSWPAHTTGSASLNIS